MGFVPILGAVGAIASVAGTAVSAISQGHAASYAAQVAKNNQMVEEQNARYASAAGQQKAEEQSRQNAALLARIRVGEAASNIDVNSGSAEDVQTSQREIGELNTQQTEQNAILQAYGYRSAAATEGAQAALDTSTANQAPWEAVLGSAGTLASNASALSFNWGSAGGTGAPGADINSSGGLTGGGFADQG